MPYIVKFTTTYPSGITEEGFISSMRCSRVFTSGQQEDAKRFHTKAEAKDYISLHNKSRQRRTKIHHEFLTVNE